MEDSITSIPLFRYVGVKGCMGYPPPCAQHATAEWWFQTPEVIKRHNQQAISAIYLCQPCVSAFLAEVAVGIAVFE